MSSSSRPKKGDFGRDIHRLLAAAEAGQKADILTYSSGHLGPYSLNKGQPQREVTKAIWKTSQSQEDSQNPLTCKQKQSKAVTNIQSKILKDSPSSCSASIKLKTLRSKDAVADKKEEDINLPKIVSSSSNSSQPSLSPRKPNSHFDPETKPRFCSNHIDQESLRNEGQLKSEHLLDQQVIAYQELWSGNNVAEVHERKLRRELEKLSAQSRPSRDRLAVFSDVFDDVCEGSPVFGRILREIKTEYDLYVNYLMGPTLLDHFLNNSPKDLSCGNARGIDLRDAEKEICKLEQEVRAALEEKMCVKEELQKFRPEKDSEDSDDANSSLSEPGDKRTAINCSSGVQSKRLQVLSMWGEIQQLEEEIKEKLVPTAATVAIEKNTKAIKTQIMRLIASNHRLKAANEDLENNINMVLDREKASKATRRIWKGIHCDPQQSENICEQVKQKID